MEPKIATVGGAFSVVGGTYREIQLDIADMSIEQIADTLVDRADPPSLCHECGRGVSDPELDELAAVVINGVEYVRDENGAWTAGS